MRKEVTDIDMDFTGHIEELRSRLIKAIVALLLFAVVAFMLKEQLIEVIFAPSKPGFTFNRWMLALSERLSLPALAINQSPIEIINTKMAGQFNLHIKSSIFAGFVCSMPYLLYQLWAFVRPALSPEIIKVGGRMMFQVTLLFFVGLTFGYLFISPLAINFLASYNFSSNIENLIEAPSYLSTVINIALAASLIFQLPHLVFLLARIGILTSASMRRYRHLAIVIIVILSAIITPPDIFSQLLIALPFYMLYEYGIIIAQREERRRREKIE